MEIANGMGGNVSYSQHVPFNKKDKCKNHLRKGHYMKCRCYRDII